MGRIRRVKLDAEGVGAAFEYARKLTGGNAPYLRFRLLENNVHIRMRKRFYQPRRKPTQIPVNRPVMIDPGRKFGWRTAACVAKGSHRSGRMSEYAAWLSECRIERLFYLRTRFLSRFYNHR